jgi:UDP-N-acetylmuramoyl-tripeptide--D-alanyl-D-alanine ligase
VLNADDPFFPDWRARARCEYVLGFGTGAAADCRLIGEPQFAGSTTRFRLRLPDASELAVELPLIGQANVMNALAAAAAAHAVGCSAEDIREGLERAHVVKGRLTALTGRGGSTIIDDSYNANPTAARAALDYLATLPGTRIFVLGDMAELGPEAPRLHAEIGEYARARCDSLLAVGGLAAEAAQAFGENGRSFADIDQLAAELGTRLGDGVTVLIKGSRVMGLERLVASLVVDASAGAKPC